MNAPLRFPLSDGKQEWEIGTPPLSLALEDQTAE